MMFIPYVCCGDPNMDFSYKLIKILSFYSEIVEIGIPFSDPIADGKTIQIAANRALNNKVNVKEIFSMVKKLRIEGVSTPFVFMTYYNIVFAYGKERFLAKMKQVNVQGIIIPDLPFGEDREFEKLAKKYGIKVIHLIASNTSNERARKIIDNSEMFTYLVSVTGTTGVRDIVTGESIDFVRRVIRIAGNEKKLCVGFGVSNFEQAKKFEEAGASGVIVGSKLIEIYSKHIHNKGIDAETAFKEILMFVKDFK